MPDVSISENENGSVATLAPGETLAISLRENPTTGFRWHFVCEPDAAICQLTDDKFASGDAIGATGRMGAMGAGGVRVWTFRALAAGETRIEFIERRAWETEPPNHARRFFVTVKVSS